MKNSAIRMAAHMMIMLSKVRMTNANIRTHINTYKTV